MPSRFENTNFVLDLSFNIVSQLWQAVKVWIDSTFEPLKVKKQQRFTYNYVISDPAEGDL